MDALQARFRLRRLLAGSTGGAVLSILLTVLFGAGVLAALVSIEFVAPMHRVPEADFEFGPMESGVPAVQTLGATGSGFAGVELLTSREGDESAAASLSVRIRRSDPPQIIREKTLQVPFGSEFQPLRYSFEPLPELQSASVEYVTWITGDTRVFLGGSKGDEYPEGRLYYRDQPMFDDQDVSLAIYRRTTVWTLLSELKDRSIGGFVAAAATGLTVVLLISISVVKAGAIIGEYLHRRPASQPASSSPRLNR